MSMNSNSANTSAAMKLPRDQAGPSRDHAGSETKNSFHSPKERGDQGYLHCNRRHWECGKTSRSKE